MILWRKKLTARQRSVLAAMAQGATLKAHRYLDGAKVYRLHPLADDGAQIVDGQTVDGLKRLGLVDSNKKFPAATYLLTAQGRLRVQHLTSSRSP